jgi:hypothetical protein
MKIIMAAWFEPASVAVPLEGRGPFQPPPGVARGPWTVALWPKGTRFQIAVRAAEKGCLV